MQTASNQRLLRFKICSDILIIVKIKTWSPTSLYLFYYFCNEIKQHIMKRILFISLLLLSTVNFALAQKKYAEIKFENTTYDFGKFPESDPVQKCVFTFTNTGNTPLVIKQAIASCGCTVPSYTKKPIEPGEKGEIKVTYSGRGTFPARFKKTITVRTNGVNETVRLYIVGEMTEEK